MIRVLLQNGANVNAQDKRIGYTPLHYGILKGKLILEVLSVYSLLSIYFLSFAIFLKRLGKPEIVELLLKGGGLKDIRNKYNHTPLDMAIAFSQNGMT